MSGHSKDKDGSEPDEGPKPVAEDESTDSHDAADAEPVKQYYMEKKKRYLREGASDLKAGTPYEWEDAQRYAQEQERGKSEK